MLVPVVMFLLLAAVSIAWLAADEAPLIFDPSAHLFSSIFFDSFPGRYLSEERQFYPPLVHVFFATSLRFTNYSIDASIGVVALFFVAVLLASTYLIGVERWSPRVGAFATILLALYPATYIHSRSLLLDLPLMAMVAAAVLALLRARGFQNLAWSAGFGVLCAIGLLTKQAFLLAIIAPLAYELLRAPRHKTTALHLGLALLPVIVVLLWWYLPRVDWFFGDYRTAQEDYARSRGDPDTWSLLGLTYYLQGTWYQTTLLFAVLWLAMLPFFLRATSRGLLISWWAGVVLSSTFLVLKDSRFLMPALPAIALMTAIGLDRMRNGVLVLAPCVAFGLLQLWGGSFGGSWLPEGDVITNRVESGKDVQAFAQHWRMTAADSSVADRSGWGGAAAGLAALEGERIGIIGDRILVTATRNPDPGGDAGQPAVVEELTCADRARFAQLDLIVVQSGGRFGVSDAELPACSAGLVEDHRIPINVPRLLQGVDELIVFRQGP